MTRHRPQLRGFTLLELMMVMVVLAAVALMVIPTMSGFSAGRELDNAAAEIVAVTRWARTQAISEGEVYRLNFDTNQKRYWLSQRLNDSDLQVSHEFGRTFTLPDSVEARWDGPANGGVGYVDFDPTGRTQAVAIQLTGRSGRVVQVACLSPTELFKVVQTN